VIELKLEHIMKEVHATRSTGEDEEKAGHVGVSKHLTVSK
jgi:hypothetical protein